MVKTTPKQVKRLLERSGLMTMTLSASAPEVPALVPLVAGGPVRGSWWGHPKGKEIFALATAIDDDPDVLAVKLLDGKVTFVARRLFGALLRCVGDAGWRKTALGALGAAAQALEQRVAGEGEILFDPPPPADLKRALAQLESRLLLATTSVHTANGRHAPRAETWSRWARRVGAKPSPGSRAYALGELETAAGTSLPALR